MKKSLHKPRGFLRHIGAGVAGLLACLAVATPTWATAKYEYPVKEVTLVVPYPAGGNSDSLGRIYAERLRDKLGITVIVENRPGGTTSLGTGQVARSKPDGATLLLATSTAFTVLPHLRNDLPYDPEKSFTFVGSLAGYLPIMTARTELGVKSYQDLIDLAKSKPGELTWGSSGIASGGHLAGEIVKNLTGADMLHIPFKGSADTIPALLGGHVDFIIDGVALELIKSGRSQGLATFSNIRHPELPDVPALSEVAPDAVLPFQGFWGIAVAAGTPDSLVDTLAKATADILAEPDTQQRFLRSSLSAEWLPGDEYQQELAKSRVYYGELLKKIGLTTQ